MYLRTLKMAIGAMLAILLAEFIGLSSSLTAGIIVLLSLGKTKRTSFDIAWVRVKAVFLALMVGSVVFEVVGFYHFSFGLFLLLFVPMVFKFKLEDGIIIGTVLTTHLINAGVIDKGIIYNTGMLFVIGVVVALLFNLYMPSMQESMINDQRLVESKFREIILLLALMIRGDQDSDVNEKLQYIGMFIEDAVDRARANADNYLLSEMSYYTKYMMMRKLQFEVMTRMSKLVEQVDMMLIQADLIADLTEEFALTLEESNSGEALLLELERVSTICKGTELPKNRIEFENRAILFQYLNELRHMIELKREFSHKYGEKI